MKYVPIFIYFLCINTERLFNLYIKILNDYLLYQFITIFLAVIYYFCEKNESQIIRYKKCNKRRF